MKLDGVEPALKKVRGHYEGSTPALERLFSGLRKGGPPAFLLHTGDVIDAYRFDGENGAVVEGQIEHARAVLARCPLPIYLALGNHDIQHYRRVGEKVTADRGPDVASAARREWRQAAACFRDGSYYAFSRRSGKTEYHFLVLDNGEPLPPEKSAFLTAQLEWLEKELARRRNGPIIVAMHIPLAKDRVSEAIAQVLSRSAKVELILAGHRHTNGIEEIPLGGRLVPQIRTSAFAIDERDFRRVLLWEDRIEVFATGKPGQLEKTIALAAAAAAAAK